jgi:hypothetical protein
VLKDQTEGGKTQVADHNAKGVRLDRQNLAQVCMISSSEIPEIYGTVAATSKVRSN